MSIGTTDKVLLGITVVIATAAAGAVRVWMGFPVLVVGVIAAVALVRVLNAQGKKVPGDSNLASTDASRINWADEVEMQHRKLADDLALDPVNKHLVGNIWHRDHQDD